MTAANKGWGLNGTWKTILSALGVLVVLAGVFISWGTVRTDVKHNCEKIQELKNNMKVLQQISDRLARIEGALAAEKGHKKE
jgi:hypothetical protein